MPAAAGKITNMAQARIPRTPPRIPPGVKNGGRQDDRRALDRTEDLEGFLELLLGDGPGNVFSGRESFGFGQTLSLYRTQSRSISFRVRLHTGKPPGV
jgi:hypothetical protein